MIADNTLIYDIETRTFGKPDATKDILKIFGCYSYKTKKYYLLTGKEDIQKIIKAHRYLVGFNNREYDDPILKRHGIDMEFKTIIDLRVIFKNRASQMKIKKGMLGDLIMRYSLAFISELLGIVSKEENKLDIDYTLFQKDFWTPKERKEIAEYTKRDIEVTKKLYEFVEDYFSSFKDFITPEDVRKKIYLTASTAKFAYKAICNAMDWKEVYGDFGQDDDRISGGYVAYPAGEKFEGDIYCLDYNSLYPHIMIQCNLYGRKKENVDSEPFVWTGGGLWKVEGTYFSKDESGVGKLLHRWYMDRLKYKKEGDRREYTIKIIINTIYGILNNPYYTLVYDRIAGGDCTRIGRQWVKHARALFKEAGYKVVYTDTDSVYVLDHNKDKDRVLEVVKRVVDDIKGSVPFPKDTFDMGIDDEIKHIFFFKGQHQEDKDTDVEMDEEDFVNKPLGYMKKNYIYVTKEDRVVVKNLGIKKKSISALSKTIFWDHLVPNIKKGQVKFSKVYMNDLIKDLLKKDISLALMRREVNPAKSYKVPTSLPAQIATRYGAGIHFLMPNTRGIGVGKGKKFCTLEEFKEHDLRLEHIDLDNVWKELSPFIKKVVTGNIFEF